MGSDIERIERLENVCNKLLDVVKNFVWFDDEMCEMISELNTQTEEQEANG